MTWITNGITKMVVTNAQAPELGYASNAAGAAAASNDPAVRQVSQSDVRFNPTRMEVGRPYRYLLGRRQYVAIHLGGGRLQFRPIRRG